MNSMTKNTEVSMTRLLPLVMAMVVLFLTATAFAAAPGIKGTSFSLVATPAFTSQPDGSMVYSWGYGCSAAPAATAFAPTMPGQPAAPCRFRVRH